MKLDQLRKIIREEVRSAVKEELQEVMNEAVKAASTPTLIDTSTKRVNIKEVTKKTAPKSAGKTSIEQMLADTRANLTESDYKNVYAGTSNMAQKPNFASSMATNMGMTATNTPMPGLDISKFDFVKKAGAVYQASVEKDKQKHGIA